MLKVNLSQEESIFPRAEKNGGKNRAWKKGVRNVWEGGIKKRLV